ncbi:hypothetical protein ATCC90586_003184 [Pythium insidiosum]|nr:hypothetical protein ATCC90586_003184 [Pythium insidiosum]
MALTNHPFLVKALAIVDACQVELQGRYSLPRFREVLQHAKTTTWVVHLAVLLLAPVPSLLFTVAMDALPLQPPADGIQGQTAWLYVRVFVVGWIMSHMIATQFHQSAPSLPLSSRQLWGVSVTVGLSCMPWFYALGYFLGFPTPFFLLLLCPDSVPLFLAGMWLVWKDALRVDAQGRTNIVRYLPVFFVQVAMVYVYSFYGVAFAKVDKGIQPIMALGLPVIKLVFKNIVSKGVFHMEDLAPTTIVFNVDVFHALFVSGSMQQSASSGTTLTIMIVDAVQSGVAYLEVYTLLRRVQRIAVQIADTKGEDKDTENNSGVNVVVGSGHRNSTFCRVASKSMIKLGVIDYALVTCVLKMLHMIEFYVLIEYTEVAVSTLYTLYMSALLYLPNRAYYQHLAHYSETEMRAMVSRLAIYSCLELASFVLFCVVLNRKLRHLSTIQQLAFVLQKHASVALTTLAMWVFYVPQVTFEHFGADYSFQFKWLRGAS